MQAIRQIKDVKNRTIVVYLPDEFPAIDQVEVIILPAQPANTGLPLATQTEGDAFDAVQHFLAIDTSQLTDDQRRAYTQASKLVRKGRRPHEARLLGLFSGLVQIADDFDTSGPDEDLFWGAGSNEDGLSLEQ